MFHTDILLNNTHSINIHIKNLFGVSFKSLRHLSKWRQIPLWHGRILLWRDWRVWQAWIETRRASWKLFQKWCARQMHVANEEGLLQGAYSKIRVSLNKIRYLFIYIRLVCIKDRFMRFTAQWKSNQKVQM